MTSDPVWKFWGCCNSNFFDFIRISRWNGQNYWKNINSYNPRIKRLFYVLYETFLKNLRSWLIFVQSRNLSVSTPSLFCNGYADVRIIKQHRIAVRNIGANDFDILMNLLNLIVYVIVSSISWMFRLHTVVFLWLNGNEWREKKPVLDFIQIWWNLLGCYNNI